MTRAAFALLDNSHSTAQISSTLKSMRFAQRLAALTLVSMVSSFAHAAPLLATPRVAAYAGYTRLVLDLPAGVTPRLEPLGAALRVTLSGVVATPGTVSVKKPELSGYTLANASNNTVLNVVTPQGVAQHSGFKTSVLEAAPGKTGSRLVLDFSGAFADTSKLIDPTPLRLPFLPAQPLTVLLDAGHGGSDPGALSNGLREDTLNLNMVMRVKAWLERVPGVRVELTRLSNTVFSNDKRTDLSARARMSRGKTLFVSLHANAVPRASWNSQFGAETYYFNPKLQKPLYVPPLAPLVVAAPPDLSAVQTNVNPVVKPIAVSQSQPPAPEAVIFETPIAPPDDPQPVAPESEAISADGLLPKPIETPETPLEDPSSLSQPPETLAPIALPEPIIAPLTLTEPQPLTTPAQIGISLTWPGLDRVGESKSLASSVQSRLVHATRVNNRGVRSSDFYVIKNAECPAILVEIGFLTHPIEAQMLKNTNYLERVSYGVASGVTAYLSNLASP